MVRRRMPSQAQRAEREKILDQLAYLREQRDDFHDTEEEAERRIREATQREIDRKHDIVMSSIYREIKAGRPKTVIAEALGMSRQTLDYWIKRDGGANSVSAEVIESMKPKRYTALDYTYATYAPHTGVLVHDNEGEFEDMLLLPATGQTRGWEWGDRHTSYLHPTKERIPQEVLDLIVEDEVEAYRLASRENQDKWRGWTSNPAIKGFKSGPKVAPVAQSDPEEALGFAKLTGEDDDLEFA